MQFPDHVPDVAAVDVAEGRARVDSGAIVLDVREPNEWDAGHIEGATWIPLGDLPERFGELDRSTAIVVACTVGVRSAIATKALADEGYEAVNLAGGVQAWVEAGESLVDGNGDPGNVA